MLKNRSHGAVHDRKKSLVWCAGHKRWIHDAGGKWEEHTNCNSEDRRLFGLQGRRRSIMLTKIRLENSKSDKPKRISKTVHFCKKHGRFSGYRWGGHRRICDAPEVSKEIWKARSVTINSEGDTLSERTVKTLQRGHALRFPTRRVSAALMPDSIPLPRGMAFRDACREIGVESLVFVGMPTKETPWIVAKVVSVAADHPYTTPFLRGDEILKINQVNFKSSEEFISLIREASKRKESTVYVTFQRGYASPSGGTVVLRSHSTGEEVFKLDEKKIFVPDADIIVKVGDRLKALDAEIVNAKAQAEMFTKECLELPRKLSEARDLAQQADKRVGELEGKRREFMNGIGHALKGALK